MMKESAVYPIEILPSKTFIGEINTASLLEQQGEAVIGHWLCLEERERDYYIDETWGEGNESLTTEALPLKRMANLSCNLLGGVFSYNHFAFVTKSYGDLSWDKESDIVDDLVNADNYTEMKRYMVIGWHIRDLYNKVLPYSRVFSKKTDYDNAVNAVHCLHAHDEDLIFFEEWENVLKNADSKTPSIPMTGRVLINHDPVNLNYWHFTIDLQPMDSAEVLERIKKAWENSLANELLKILQNTFFEIKEDYNAPSIPETVWLRPA